MDNFSENNERAKAIIVASLIRNGNDWKFNSIGEYNNADDLDQLESIILTKYI